MTILDRYMLIEIISTNELPVTTRNVPFNKGGGMIICNIYLIFAFISKQKCVYQNIRTYYQSILNYISHILIYLRLRKGKNTSTIIKIGKRIFSAFSGVAQDCNVIVQIMVAAIFQMDRRVLYLGNNKHIL